MDDLFEHQMESERDKAINGFYTHFMIFLAVITGLAIINLVEGDRLWVQWVLLGWGAGVAVHAFQIFVRKPQLEHKLREIRRVNEEKLRERQEREAAEAVTPPVAPSEPDPDKSST